MSALRCELLLRKLGGAEHPLLRVAWCVGLVEAQVLDDTNVKATIASKSLEALLCEVDVVGIAASARVDNADGNALVTVRGAADVDVVSARRSSGPLTHGAARAGREEGRSEHCLLMLGLSKWPILTQ